jgi:ubiquinone/menaquinone biosynthesis C-methylase UbiE
MPRAERPPVVAEPNASQREQWNGESGLRWIADADRRDRVLQTVLDTLVRAADLRPDDDVLDIGCGCGATTIAAHSELTTGRALGLDISGPMLDVARTRAARLDRISFHHADAQTFQFADAFDVVLSRFGTMFFDDPVTAHANLRSALRPGGRLCLATWQPLEANDWLLAPGTVLLAHGSMPPTDPGPGMFAQADPDQVEAVLTAAGWTDIRIDPITIELRLGDDAAEATDYLADTGIARRVLDTIAPEARATALAAVTELLAQYDDDGVRLGAGINLIHARA